MADVRIALLRGINVGRAKRIAMADLRKLVGDLGYLDVRTLLNSGNVLFAIPDEAPRDAAARIEEALEGRLGISARVTVLTAAELAVIIDGNPLLDIADNPSRLMVAVLRDAADRQKLARLAERDWGNEALAIGDRVAYLWCPEGLLASEMAAVVSRTLGDAVTTRNWATILKLWSLAAEMH